MSDLAIDDQFFFSKQETPSLIVETNETAWVNTKDLIDKVKSSYFKHMNGG